MEREFLTLCLVLSFSVTAWSSVCPHGWRDYPASSSCYLITGYQVRYSFDRAEDRCTAQQAELIVISDQMEMAWLVKEIQQFSATGLPPKMAWWLGLDDKGQGQGLKYLNGSDVNMNMIPWAGQNPPAPSSMRQCASVVNGTVQLTNCSISLGLVCERSKGVPLSCDVEDAWVYINSSCFKYFPGQQPWSMAQSTCRQLEGELAKITTAEEVAFVWDNARLSSSSSSWVGLKSNILTRKYKWLDGSVVDKSLPWWTTNQPQSLAYMLETDPDLCGLISANGTRRLSSWTTDDCNEKHSFTCSKPQGVCADGWISHLGICIKFYAQHRVIWSTARQFCQAQGADLIIVPTKSYQELVNLYLAGLRDDGMDSFWLGLQGTINKTFEWVDRKYSMTWTNWVPGSSHNTSESLQRAYINTGDKTGKWQLTPDLTTRKGVACFISGWKSVKEVVTPFLDQCPDQWQVAGDTCVYLSNENASWSKSRAGCQEMEAQLLVVNSPDVQTFLESHIVSGQFWIGLSDRSSEGDFTWVNGSLLEVANWAPGQPDAGEDENCVVIRPDSQGVRWLDTVCQERKRYICQKPTLNKTGQSVSNPTQATVPYSARCGTMWEERAGTNLCYQFRETALSWMDAHELCSSFNGSLVSIVSREEQSYIEGRLRVLNSIDVWIGASDRRKEAGWQWQDEAPFAFLNWYAGEPNDQRFEHCAAINTHTMRWFDYPCSLRMGFICKKTAEDSLTTSPLAMTVPSDLPAGQYYGCPVGWLAYDGRCYLMRRSPASWTEAQTSCRQEGGALASISSELENKFVWSQLPKESCQNIHASDSQCQVWADAKECQRNPSWMSVNCQLSCSLCAQSCSDRHTHYKCRFWASIGECLRNPNWMWSNCALSCGCDTSINEGYWLGLNDRYSQMTFVWDDLSAMTFTNWLSNEPNNYLGKQEDCVKMHSVDGAWSDEICDQKNAGYVCERGMAIMDTPTISPDRVGCPISGFAYGAVCFVLVDTPMTWADAKAFCGRQNATLATVPDSITGAFITSELIYKTSSYWLGLSSTAGTYSWDRGDPVQYLAWAPSHTGKENNSCVAIRSKKPVGLWESVSCQTLLPFVCETYGRGLAQFSTTAMTTTASVMTTVQAQCPPSWLGHGDNCYQMFLVSKNWFEAEAACESYGGSLASVHDNSTNLFVKTLVGWDLVDGYWIGLTDHVTESSYQWSDQSPFDYSRWQIGEPNNATAAEDCVEGQAPSMQWNDVSCYLSRPYVCSVARGFPVPSATTTAAVTPAPQCHEEGWLFYAGLCYFASPPYGRNSSLSWFESRRRCQSVGGDLVSITSEDENNFLITWLSKRDTPIFWTGFNQLEQSSYIWADGSPNSFVAWGPNEPNDFMGGERCVSMDGNKGFWRDDECGTQHGFVCKKGNTSTNTGPPVTFPVGKWTCPDGFFSAGSSIKCYYIGGRGNVSRNWEDARDLCRNLTSPKMVDIASISSRLEQDLVTSLMWDLGTDLWLGLTDRLVANQYRWQDNSEVTYTNWAAGQPVRHVPWGLNKENCVEMLRQPHLVTDTAKWNDASCSKKNAFLCQTTKTVDLTSSAAMEVSSPPPSATREENSLSSTCPDDFFPYKAACYSVIKKPQTWREASDSCRLLDGDLAATSDIFETARLSLALLDSDQAWIGLTFEQASSRYVWSDGRPVEVTFWSSTDPDHQNNDSCVALVKASWNDTSCSLALPSICQINKEAPPSPSPPSSGECPGPNQTSFGDFCYLAEPNDLVSWPEASYKCAQLGMEVASVHSEAENNFVKGYINHLSAPSIDSWWIHPQSVWLGLQKNLQGGFRWSDRSPVVYLNWDYSEPSSVTTAQREDCVKLSWESGRWSDGPCLMRRLGYICKTGKILTRTLSPQSETVTVLGSTSTPDNHPQASGEAHAPVDDLPTDPSYHYLMPIQGQLTTRNEKTFPAGHVAGILIGFLGLCVIIVGVVFIVKNRKSSGLGSSSGEGQETAMPPYQPGYDNALYHQKFDDQSGQITQVVTIGTDKDPGCTSVENSSA